MAVIATSASGRIGVGMGDGLKLPMVAGRRSLREEVAHALRAALIAGEMRPGVVYSAPALAEQFGVSPTPVREACLNLAQEGLVEAVPNKGFRVRPLSDADLDEFTEIRALLEVPTVGRIAATAQAAQLEPLRPLADKIVEAARQRDLINYLDADMEFHLALLTLAGNTHLVDMVRDLRNRSRLYGLRTLAQQDLLDSAGEHVRLLELISAGDADAAQELMRVHIGHLRTTWART